MSRRPDANRDVAGATTHPRTVAVACCLAALVLLAGCGTPWAASGPGGDSDGPGAAATTDGPGAAATTDGPGAEDGDGFPPGVTAAGVRNATALGAAHYGTLRATTSTQTYVVTSRHANGSLRGRSRAVLRSTPSTELRRATFAGAAVFGNRIAAAAWANGTVRASRVRYANGTTRYRAARAPLYSRGPPASVFARALGEGGGRVVDERTVDGTPAYVLRSADPAVGSVAGVDGPTRNASLRLVVTADGVLRSATLRFESRERVFAGPGTGADARTAGTWTRVTVRFTVRQVGSTTVERPAWVERALDRLPADNQSRAVS